MVVSVDKVGGGKSVVNFSVLKPIEDEMQANAYVLEVLHYIRNTFQGNRRAAQRGQKRLDKELFCKVSSINANNRTIQKRQRATLDKSLFFSPFVKISYWTVSQRTRNTKGILGNCTNSPPMLSFDDNSGSRVKSGLLKQRSTSFC